MTGCPVQKSDVWQRLEKEAEKMQRPENHLRHLVTAANRLEAFSLNVSGVFYDFSRQRVNDDIMASLCTLAAQCRLTERFKSMMGGEAVNRSEQRAALHTAARAFDDAPIHIGDMEVTTEMKRVRDAVASFADRVHNGDIVGSKGDRFEHVVVIGIGGSYLGTEFVATALAAYADKQIQLHYLANVDIHNFGAIAAKVDLAKTLWVVVSKSYTTAETLANANQAAVYMRQQGLDPSAHLVTVTSKGSPGDDPSNPVLASFNMFDFIGGRYSVTSAVGAVPLSLYLGFDRFEGLLRGARQMDHHAAQAPPAENIPLTAALLAIWNNNFLGYPAQGIIPYATPLAKLAPHIQQLNMESNGKSVTMGGTPLELATGTIIFGEPGTNAQHSFFQLAHQGRPFPIDFIGVVQPQYKGFDARSRGVSNHQELWANLISQPAALAAGREHEDPARAFSGNRPSSTLLLQDLSPENVGRLLSFYEARTVFEAFVWDINPFDQFGVELGKTMASGLRQEMAARNDDPGHTGKGLDPIQNFYLDVLFKGKL